MNKLAGLLLLVGSIGGSWALAQDASPHVDLLRPADTTSPRATLRAFLSDADFVIRTAMTGADTNQQVVAQAFQRAVETLDLSNTPNGQLVAVQIRRVVLLKEILDRVALPDDAKIPGRAEVAEGGLTRWAIPNTRIRIVHMKSGPRRGEFLFSAATVEQLDRLYDLVRNLPYQPGATEGAHDFLEKRQADAAVEKGRIDRRLKPIDTSTPRTVIQGLLRSVNKAYELVMEAEAGWRATPRTMTLAEAERLDARARRYLARATTALDLSEVPEAQREDVAIETVLQLKELLDRMPLHPIGTIPDALGVARLRAALPSGASVRWRVPNSEIDIVEMREGGRQGEFLFSSRTVERVEDLYWQVADLPYRTEASVLVVGYVSPGLSPGFYHYYTSTPGSLVPYASKMGRFLADVPPWLGWQWRGQTLAQWLGLAVCLLLVGIIVYFIFRFVWQLSRGLPTPLGEWAQIVAPITVSILILASAEFADEGLNITGAVLASVTAAEGYVALLMRALAVFLLFRAGAETIAARSPGQEGAIDASLLRIIARVFGFLAALYVFVAGAQKLGADLVPLIAGLGVGGLAVALAAQKTLANFIGTLILFAERPVRQGDSFRAGDLLGTVEEIGLHSTRIRTPERSVVTVPNAQLSEMRIDNISRRDRRLFKVVLSLREDTTTEQMRGILKETGQLLSDHPKVLPDTSRVRFIRFGDYSQDVELVAYFDCVGQAEFLAIQQELLMRVEEIIVAAGSGFSVPSQITHITGAPLPEAQGTTPESD